MDAPSKTVALLKASFHSHRSFSEKTGISLSRISKILKGASTTVSERLKISKALLSTHRTMEWEIESGGLKSLARVEEEAMAGFTTKHRDPHYLEKLESYRIPGFNGKDSLLFKVQGHSMCPTIAEDDYLVCQRMADKEEMEGLGLVVVLLEQQLLVKRLLWENNHWILRSDNPDFEDVKVERKNIEAVWKVIGKVTSEFLKTSKDDFNRILELKGELAKLKAEVELCRVSFFKVGQK